MEKESNEKEVTVQMCDKASIIDENIKLERSCLAYAFGLPHQENFRSLTISTLLNNKDYE